MIQLLIINMLCIELGLFTIKKTNIHILYNKFNQIFKCKVSFYKSFIMLWTMIVLFQLQILLMFITFDQTFYYNTDGWMIWLRLIIYLFISLYAVNQLYYLLIISLNKFINIMKSLLWVFILHLLVLTELFVSVKAYSLEWK